MKVAFTGHRPHKLGGYNLPNPIKEEIKLNFTQILTELQPELAISGMALGLDQWAIEVCLELNIPFIAAIPFTGQESIWPEASQQIYRTLLSRAQEQVIISPGGYSAKKMLIRDRWMVEHCNVLLGCWDGTAGGTAHTMKYAQSIDRQIIRLNPLTWEISS